MIDRLQFDTRYIDDIPVIINKGSRIGSKMKEFLSYSIDNVQEMTGQKVHSVFIQKDKFSDTNKTHAIKFVFEREKQ